MCSPVPHSTLGSPVAPQMIKVHLVHVQVGVVLLRVAGRADHGACVCGYDVHLDKGYVWLGDGDYAPDVLGTQQYLVSKL